MLSGSELWLLRLMADRGLALVVASGLLVVIEQEGDLQVAAASGDAAVGIRILPLASSALGAVYRAGAALDLESPRGPEAQWLHELGVDARAVLLEPMSLPRQGGGLVIALRREGRFTHADRDALRAFAASVAHRLAAERSVEIERLRHGIEARERERTRWAREIHDETVQGLGALRLMLASARDIDDPVALRRSVEQAIEGLGGEIEGLRHLITELRPAALDDLGLVPALEALARRAYAVDGLDVETRIELRDGASARLDPELESTIYRVVQEALTNVGRHANATRASVTIAESGGVLRVAVTDDGRAGDGLSDGSARREPREPNTGFGIAGMRERAELVGGELSLLTRPGAGTTVELRVPLDFGRGRPLSPAVSR